MSEPASPIVVGRYILHAPIARGGMATIHLARLCGAEGFSRLCAAKRLHPQFAEDADFLAMFLDEARIASKVHHPNVVPVLDVVHTGAEVILVQEYVHGVPLDKLLRAAREEQARVPAAVVVAVAADLLAGLHAAHETTDELGTPLAIVHRDVSPQNVMVGVDGITRVLDFGVAKATLNAHVTRAGTFKGKLTYTSPEQMRGIVTRATDLYAAAVLLWEALAGERMHTGRSEAEVYAAVSAGLQMWLTDAVDPATVPPERWAELARLDPILARGMAFAPEDRWPTARAMADALIAAVPPATPAVVSRWVKQLGNAYLEGREKLIVTEESSWRLRASAVPASAPEAPPDPTSPPARGETGNTLRPSSLPVVERRRFEQALVAGLLLIGGLLASVLLLLVRHAPEPVPTALPAAPAAPASLPAPPEAAPAPAPPPSAPPAAETVAAPSPPPPVHPPPRVVAPVRAAPAVAAAPRPPLPATAAPRPPPPSAAAPVADCTPPFFFDGKKKVFKPGCL